MTIFLFLLTILMFMQTKMNKNIYTGIDMIDEKILNALLTNAKMPLRDLAKTVGVSFVTVMNRIKRLEQEKIIRGYIPLVDYEKLGHGIHVLIDIQIAKGKLIELEKKIAQHPNVCAVYDTTGNFDAALFAKFKSTREMDAFLKKIQTYDFVERTNTRLILHTMKETQIRL